MSEECAMETCEGGQSDCLSSDNDINGFLSSSCMETDGKNENDPFSSDNTLGFPEDSSSRFESECILTSPIAEGVSMQPTSSSETPSVSSLIAGDGLSLGNCSVLTDGSLLMCDIPNLALQKPITPGVQLNPSNVVLMNRNEGKVEQKFGVLSPFQLVTHPPASGGQSHTVVIGNSSAASFVKSVLKDPATVLPSTSSPSMSHAFMPAKDSMTMSMAPIVLLNPAFLSSLHLLQPELSPAMSSAPVLIQLPAGMMVGRSPECQQLATTTSDLPQSCPIVFSSAASMSPVTSASVDTGVSQCSTATNPPCQSDTCIYSRLDTPASNSSPCTESMVNIVPSSSASLCNVASVKDESQFKNTTSDNFNSSGNISNTTVSEPSTSHTSEQIARDPHHPVVISCTQPEDKRSKGMQQILEHFLRQNRMNTAQPDTNTDCNKQAGNAQVQGNVFDLNANNSQMTSMANVDTCWTPTSFTVPSLSKKSSSVVFILRRTDSQTGGQVTPKYGSTNENTNTMSLNLPCQTSKQDEIDGATASSLTSVSAMVDNSTPGISESDTKFSAAKASFESAQSEGSDLVTNAGTASSGATCQNLPPLPASASTDTNPQYQVIQVQLPGNLTGNLTEAYQASDGKASDDLHKLIPLTVNEKLASDNINMAHPIIICIVQEDGLMRKVNINPTESETYNHKAGKTDNTVNNVNSTTTSGHSIPSSFSSLAQSQTSSSTTHSSTGSSPQSASSSPRSLLPNNTQSPCSSSGQESSSPQTASEGGSPPAKSRGRQSGGAKNKVFKCDLCTAGFTRLGNYTRHRKIHTLSLKDDKHFKCPDCGRAFLQRCDMNRHMAVHTQKYPFRCQTCDKGYIRKSDLVVHERFHSKERAFKCDTCGRSFYQSGDLSRHKRFVHMEQTQLSCSHCQRKYASEVTLIRHMKTAHNDLLIQSMIEQSQQESSTEEDPSSHPATAPYRKANVSY